MKKLLVALGLSVGLVSSVNANNELAQAVEFLKTGDNGYFKEIQVSITGCEVKSIITIEEIFKMVIFEDLNQVIWDSGKKVQVRNRGQAPVEQLVFQCKGLCRLDGTGLATQLAGGYFPTNRIEYNNDQPMSRINNAVNVIKKHCPGQQAARF